MGKNKSDIGHKTTLVFDNNINTLKTEGKILSIRSIEIYESRDGIHGFFPYFDDSSVDEKIKQSSFYKNFEKTYLKDLKTACMINYDHHTIEFDLNEVIEDLTISFYNDSKVIMAIKIRTNKRNVYIGDRTLITRETKQVLMKNEHFITGFSCSFILDKGIPYLSGISGYFEHSDFLGNYIKSERPNILVRAFRGLIKLNFAIIRLILLLILLSTPLHFIYYSSQNIVKGEYLVQNVSSPVQIFTDDHGFAHIKAENRDDSSFALGFIQGRDRLWQLDLYRRLARGKLSEILGKKALSFDITTRQMGWGLMATGDYEFLKENIQYASTLKILERFADGVNFWVKNNFLPLEYKFLMTGFDEWTVIDSLAILRFTNVQLGQDYILEMFYVELDRKFGKDFAELVFSFRHGQFFNADLTIIPDNYMEKLGLYKLNVNFINENQKRQNNLVESSHQEPNKTVKKSIDTENVIKSDLINEGASNSWVISGKHTKSGKPILSNDPHLNNAIPSLLYPSKIYLPENFVVGATYPGAPFFVVGNNKYISWGITTENSDVIDICEEKIEGDQYYYDNKLYDLKKIDEEIKIKNEESHKMTVKWTRNGPIIDYIPAELCNFGFDFKHFTDISFRQPLNFFNNTGPIVMEMVNYDLKSIKELKDHLKDYISPVMHFVFATVDGDIGYSPVGKIPVKHSKRDGFCKGYSSEDKINFYIPENEKPFYLNPDKGFICTANNKFSFNYKYDLNGYHYHHRARRIDDLLKQQITSTKKIDVEDSLKILSDLFDVNAEFVVPRILKILERRGKTDLKYYNELKSWDFTMNKDDSIATIYSVLELSLGENFLINNSNLSHARGLSNILFYWDFINDLLDRISKGEYIELKQCGFYSGTRDCERYFLKVFENLDENLKDFKDSNGKVKTWGAVHFNYYPNIFFDKVSFLKKIFSRKISTGGNKNTIKVSKSKYNHSEGPFTSNHASTLKYVCDLSNPESPYMIVNTGVSGNFLSRYYENFLEPSEETKLIKISHHNFAPNFYNRTIHLNPSMKN